MTHTLIGLSVSPWTAKASFTLDHARIAYNYVEHTPMIGERGLRKKAQQRHASVPLLLDEASRPVMGTLAIAEYANDRVDGALIPKDERAAVLDWHARSERLLDAGRALLFERMLANKEALRESLPSFVPAPLRGLFSFTAKQAIQFLQTKYATNTPGDPLEIAAEELEHLQRAVTARETLLDRFTYADISKACTINGFAPSQLEPRAHAMGPATRACWDRPELAARFPAVIAWRDAIYRTYRGHA